jgi:putative oxidoreductase
MTATASRALSWLDRFPYAVLAVVLRLAVAEVFWSSGQSKLLSWSTTVALFKQEYRVPLLPPELAAYLAATIGLLVRPAAAVLLGMNGVRARCGADIDPKHLKALADGD